mgnify:CR=1 FL=1
MESDKNKINPFTNQPIPPPPAFNPPGELKPVITPQEKVKPNKPVNKFDFKTIFLYVVLIGLGAVLANYAFNFFTPKHSKSAAPQFQNAISKPVAQPLIKFIPGKQHAATPPLPAVEKKKDQPLISIKKKVTPAVNPYTLSGIFFSGNQSSCIINDKILELGDSVEGAKVIRIDPEEVELQLESKTIKLNLRGR